MSCLRALQEEDEHTHFWPRTEWVRALVQAAEPAPIILNFIKDGCQHLSADVELASNCFALSTTLCYPRLDGCAAATHMWSVISLPDSCTSDCALTDAFQSCKHNILLYCKIHSWWQKHAHHVGSLKMKSQQAIMAHIHGMIHPHGKFCEMELIHHQVVRCCPVEHW